jgi:hypothetical protein
MLGHRMNLRLPRIHPSSTADSTSHQPGDRAAQGARTPYAFGGAAGSKVFGFDPARPGRRCACIIQGSVRNPSVGRGMRTQASSESAAPGPRRGLLHSAFALMVVIGGVLYLFVASAFPPHLRRFAGVGGSDAEPDATTLISTLVVIYTLFAAAYGTLAPVLIGKEGRTFWRAWALICIFLALILDLARVWNSIGDLYATTMRHLPPGKVYDAAAEFTRYLIVNAIVLLFALAVTFLPPGRLRTILSGLASKRGAATQETAPAVAVRTDKDPGQDG